MQLIKIICGLIIGLLISNYANAQDSLNSNEQNQWVLSRGEEYELCVNLLEEINRNECQNALDSTACISDVLKDHSDFVPIPWSQPVPASNTYNLVYEIELMREIGPYCFNNLSLCRSQYSARFANVDSYIRGRTEGRILAGELFEFASIPLPERIQNLYSSDPLLSQPLHFVRRRVWAIASENYALDTAFRNSHIEIFLVNADASGLDRRYENDHTYFNVMFGIFTGSNAIYEKEGVFYAMRIRSGTVEVTSWDDSAKGNNPHCEIGLLLDD